jgi:hypothetical protein
MRSSRVVAGPLVVCLLGALTAFPQTNNDRIEGTVQDESGGVPPGARLTAADSYNLSKAKARRALRT